MFHLIITTTLACILCDTFGASVDLASAVFIVHMLLVICYLPQTLLDLVQTATEGCSSCKTKDRTFHTRQTSDSVVCPHFQTPKINICIIFCTEGYDILFSLMLNTNMAPPVTVKKVQ